MAGVAGTESVGPSVFADEEDASVEGTVSGITDGTSNSAGRVWEYR